MTWLLAIAPLLLGAAAGLATRTDIQSPWYQTLRKPAWMPPPAAFGPVWTILYVLMGIAAARVAAATTKAGSGVALVLFGAQLVLNIAWSFLFFKAKSLPLALADIVALWFAVAATAAAFARIDAVAGVLMVPYVAWVTLATALTWTIYTTNPLRR